MNPIKRLAGQTAIYGIPSILTRFLNYLLVPLYTYGILTPAEYGVVNVFYSYSALLMVILTYGMETAFFRFSETHPDRKMVFSTGLTSILVSSGLFLILTNLFPSTIATWIDYSQYPVFIIWFAWILALDAIAAIPFAKLRADNRPGRFALVKSVSILSNVFLNLFFLLLCPWIYKHHGESFGGQLIDLFYRPDWTIEYIFISNLIASLVTLVMLLPQVLRIKWAFDPVLWQRMLIYALPLLIAGMAGIVNETFDRLLLRYLLPSDIAEDQVGIYSACYKIAVLMVLFIQAYRFAAEPFFFAQMKNKDAKEVYARVMDYFVISVSLIFLVTMLYLDYVFIYFIGADFRSARNVIPILMMAKLFLGIYFNISIWYKLTGKTMWGALITIAGDIVSVGLNIYWIPRSPDHLIYGYLGSAWATFFCYATMMLLGYLIGQKYYPIRYNLRKVIGFPLLAASVYIVSRILAVENTLSGILINTSLFILFLAIIAFVERKDMVSLWLSIRRKTG
ncbi:MAG: oligosaccharide flippase family protein [Bacteroidota bacterium]